MRVIKILIIIIIDGHLFVAYHGVGRNSIIKWRWGCISWVLRRVRVPTDLPVLRVIHPQRSIHGDILGLRHKMDQASPILGAGR